MSDDMVIHFSSNSSNQSDHSLPDKIAKLEARLTGKTPSLAKQPQQQQQVSVWSSASAAVKVVTSTPPGLSETSISDSDDDENTGDFLIRANTKKRQKVQESNNFAAVDHTELQEAAYDGRKNDADSKTGLDVSKKKQGRGRGTSTGRGRGSKANNDVTKSQFLVAPVSSANQLDLSDQKDFRPDGQHRNGECSSQDEGVTSLRAKIAVLEEELCKSRQDSSEYQHLVRKLENEVKDLNDQEQQGKQKTTKVISDLLISVSKTERQEARSKVRHDSLRLGSVGVLRTGTIIAETWEDGQMLKDLNAQLKQLLETKEAIERQRKLLKKRQNGDKSDGIDTESGAQEEDVIPDEVYKSRLASIKREEEVVLRERERYTLEKGVLMREMKRIRDEDNSRFNNFPVLNSRYALLNLLGKGGFSEVYKAYDLVDHRYVACKLHGLNAQWSEEKKQSYIRHANRECEIHKSLVHHHIVRLWDKFHIDMHTFCTVLEYCSGKDLDAVLKATPNLPEKEARIIIVQIVHGLVYLNKKSQKIIHYDLKPGNVLFDEFGVAKVTDFGLSKIVEDNVGSQGMELTSQGAGTYWYLPPECFELSQTPMISSKVDVWSVGVLFYQMLFGKRPFGHDQSQERILREDTIIKAKKVEFPVTRPAISNEAKDLIRRCLTYNQADRPDVLTMAQDPYLSYSKK
ncbi:PREDICTED: serine/threonine-protein kinase TOUSLED-like [Camelina sativa]|uniref:Serine/threonine-protein kinase TOUSLED-like n=1 Tax=Camelina sativa TaxID=90675 RepID=A0ABM0XZG3_CAMSA|nr:PREDICTED: serine/threonine-protein kinase TOUSLED-like [Camelina sativa]